MMLNLNKIAGLVGALSVAIAGLYSGFSFVDDRYAKTDEIAEMRAESHLSSLRLEEKILTDRVTAIQQRIWKLDDQYGQVMTSAPVSVREDYRQMQLDLADIHQQIHAVMENYRHIGYAASDTYYKYERPSR